MRWARRALLWLFAAWGVFISGALIVFWAKDTFPWAGCYVEEEYPPLKPGTPEYTAMQAAAREGPRRIVAPSGGLGVRTYLYTDEYPITGRDRVYRVKQDARDFWFIEFHPKHKKSLFGCDTPHFDGAWAAIVRKSDLMLMNRKGEEFN